MKKIVIMMIILVSQITFAKSEDKSEENTKVKTVTIVHVKDAKGHVVKMRSDNSDFSLKRPIIEHVNLSESDWLCKNKETVTGLTLFLEKNMELDTMIQNFNPDYGLTKNQIIMLGYLPDCEDFRFKLHVLSKLQNGHSFEKMIEKDI